MSHLDNNMNDPKLKSSSKKRALRRELATLQEDNNKKSRRDIPKCPICEYHIEPIYWEEHYQYELGRLAEPSSEVFIEKGKGKRGAALMARQQMEKGGKKKPGSVHEETLERIQKNRQKRSDILKHLNQNKQPLSDSEIAHQISLEEEQPEVQTCFICNQQLFGDLEAVNLHIDRCLTSSEQQEQEEQQEQQLQLPQIEETASEEQWVEYEWAGQRRVRASAMMEGGYSGAGFATASKREAEDDEDEDLDVEDDDAEQYGETQYTERDILVNADEDNEDAFALREMVSGGTTRSSPASERQGFEETVSVAGWDQHLNTLNGNTVGNSQSKLVIDSLKAHIRQLEAASRSSPHCLICLEPYKTPLTSIVCWHVHCERCWLQTLGSKKLCPQCQKITTPADLRRVYL